MFEGFPSSPEPDHPLPGVEYQHGMCISCRKDRFSETGMCPECGDDIWTSYTFVMEPVLDTWWKRLLNLVGIQLQWKKEIISMQHMPPPPPYDCEHLEMYPFCRFFFTTPP